NGLVWPVQGITREIGIEDEFFIEWVDSAENSRPPNLRVAEVGEGQGSDGFVAQIQGRVNSGRLGNRLEACQASSRGSALAVGARNGQVRARQFLALRLFGRLRLLPQERLGTFGSNRPDQKSCGAWKPPEASPLS